MLVTSPISKLGPVRPLSRPTNRLRAAWPPASPAARIGCGRSPQLNSSGRRRGFLVAAAAGGNGGSDPGSPPKPDRRQAQSRMKLQVFGMLLVRYAGLVGTAAVAGGYFLHIDALGGMHWNAHDAVLGLQCAAPVLVLDALLMLPDYSPGTTQKTIKMKVPRAVADKMEQQKAEKEAQAAEEGGFSAGSSSKGSSEAGGSGFQRVATASSSAAVAEATADPSSAPSSAPSSSAAAADVPASPAAAAAIEAVAEEAARVGGAADQGGSDLVELQQRVTVRADQPPLVAALYRLQMEKATDNVGRLVGLPLEIAIAFTYHLAQEMLYRAVILTYAVGWTIDRLYEAGADESVSLLGYQLATPQAGAVLAAVGCTATSLALLVQRQLFPVRLIAAAEKQLEEAEAAAAAREQKEARRAALAPPGPQGLGGSRRETKLEEGQRMRKVLEKVKGGLVRQRRWSTAIEGARDVAEWASYSASFLLTGNLLAPYVAAVSTDLLFSGYQRLKARQVDAAQERSMQQIRELTLAARAVEAARKSTLAPPSKPAAGEQEGSGSGDVSGEAEGDSSGANGSTANGSAADGSAASSSSAAESESGKAEAPAASSSKSDAE